MKKTPLSLDNALLLFVLSGCVEREEEPVPMESHFIPFPQLFWRAYPSAFADVSAPVEYDVQIAGDLGFTGIVDVDRVDLARYVPDRPLSVMANALSNMAPLAANRSILKHDDPLLHGDIPDARTSNSKVE
jgi:hypothetical protein